MTTTSITYTRGSAPPVTEITSTVGEAIAVTITLRNADGTARNCTGGRVEWCFGRRGADLTGHLAADGEANGVHVVTLSERDAALLDGSYQHDAWYYPVSGPRERAGATSALILERGVGPVDGAALNQSEAETGSVIDARVTDLETASATHATTTALSAVSGRVSALEGNAANYATASSVSSLSERVAAVEESGGSAPDITRQYTAGVLSALTLITTLTATDLGIPAGSRATVGLRLVGQSSAGLGLVRTVQVTVQNIGGTLSVVAFAAGVDIEQGMTEAESGWDSVVRVATGGGSLEVLGIAATSSSNWTVEVWIASLATLAAATEDTTHDVSLTVDGPQNSTTVSGLRWMRSAGITDVAVSEDSGMSTPTWLATSPETVLVGGAGPRTLYYRGRYGVGLLTAIKAASVTVVLDTTDPTISAWAVSSTSSELSITLPTPTANEADCTWYWNTTGTLPGTPTWGAFNGAYTAPAWGIVTFYLWCRDPAGNVSDAPTTRTVTFTEPVTNYYSQTFSTAAAAGTAFDAAYPGWTYTSANSNMPTLAAAGDALVYTCPGAYGRVRHSGTTSLPAEYCVTWRCNNATVSTFFGLTLNVSVDGTTGFQAFLENEDRTAWRAGHGALTYTLTGWTWTLLTGAGEGFPASWSTNVVHQITLQAVTIDGTYTRVYLWIDGQRVGYWQDGATLFTAGRGFGHTGESSGGRAFRSVLVTAAANVPTYDAVAA